MLQSLKNYYNKPKASLCRQLLPLVFDHLFLALFISLFSLLTLLVHLFSQFDLLFIMNFRQDLSLSFRRIFLRLSETQGQQACSSYISPAKYSLLKIYYYFLPDSIILNNWYCLLKISQRLGNSLTIHILVYPLQFLQQAEA